MCYGHGKVRAAQGFFSIERTCPQCQGRGQTIKDPCPKCAGQGRVIEERSLSVNIPAGIEDGTRIRLANEGEAGLRGGPPGDLYIFLSVKPHEFFQRDGADLYCKVPISMTTAALGGSFEVATLDGTPDAREGAGRHAERPPVPAQGQGHAGAAPAQCRRPLHPDRGRDAAEPVASASASCSRSSNSCRHRTIQPAIERLFRPHEGLLRVLRRSLMHCFSAVQNRTYCWATCELRVSTPYAARALSCVAASPFGGAVEERLAWHVDPDCASRSRRSSTTS